jgi:RNA polymerase sigma-70 factor (ECF subfamily)
MLAGARIGNPKSWRTMVSLYAPLVHCWCRQGFPHCERHFPPDPLRGVPGRDAPDIAQSVFLTVWRRIKDFTKDGEPGAFRRWLYTITRYKVLEYWGLIPPFPIDPIRFSRLPAPQDDSSSAAPDSHGPPPANGRSTEARRMQLHRLLDLISSEFKPRTLDAFRGVAIEGRSTKDVAKELDMSVPAVHTAKSKVLKRLREEAAASGLYCAEEM